MENPEISLPPAPPALTAHDYPTVARDPFGTPRAEAGEAGALTRTRRRVGSVLAAIAALAAKFFAAIKGAILFLPKIKLLGSAATALVSVAAYSLWFGWTFAIGFVLLLFVHELGHVIQLRREGVQASAPMFIPFMGAFISAKTLGDNALAEARVGLAGPVLGTAGAGVCLAIAELANSDFFRALAYIGFFLNLFNLLPVVPLDGGRAMAAMAPWMWFAGFGVLVALVLLFPNPILLIITFFAALELYRRWQQRKSGSLEQAAYYRVSPRNRLLVAGVYIGLVVVLVLGMEVSHILASGNHSFRSL
jgi:Zn-dependent protease